MRGLRHGASPLLAPIAAAVVSMAGCSEDGLLQGTPYLPNGDVPIDPASVREAGTACQEDAGCTDGGEAPPPVRDAGALEAGAPPPEAPKNTCSTAREVGTVAGDGPSAPVTAEGRCSEYVRVRVTESSTSALGAAMRLSLTLSPAGHDFDLYAFLDAQRDQLACSAPYARSETNGLSPETISLQWGEGSVANGNDDGRWVVVAVTSAQGPCPPSASWTLSATGNK